MFIHTIKLQFSAESVFCSVLHCKRCYNICISDFPVHCKILSTGRREKLAYIVKTTTVGTGCIRIKTDFDICMLDLILNYIFITSYFRYFLKSNEND